MTDLAERLRTDALCHTSDPAEAVSALIGAAGAILLARFPPAVAAGLVSHAMEGAMQATVPADGETVQ